MKRTVLVIDDDKMILDMIQGVLADKFDVSAVNDGQKAFRVLERIRCKWFTDIIFCTGFKTFRFGIFICYRSQKDYICKPFTANALTARIERVLNIQDCVLS